MIRSVPMEPKASRSLEEKKALAKSLLVRGQLPVCALSAGQQALWLLQQQSPQSPAYNEGVVLKLPRATNMDWLRRTLEGLMEAHPILRTIYRERNGRPYGCIKPSADLDFSVLNAEDWSETALQRRMGEAQNQPFQLDRDPVVRFFFYLSHPYLYVQVVAHHIACDGWSLTVLLRELLKNYEALSLGGSMKVKQRPGYEQFVSYERSYLERKGKEASDYWRQLLAGCQAITRLSEERCEEVEGHGMYTCFIPVTEKRVEEAAAGIGASSFTAWLGLFQVLVAQYTGQDEVLVGTPFMNRELSSFNDMVGFFANTILVRSNVDDKAFDRQVQLLAKHVAASKQWGAYPFYQVVNENRDVLGEAAQGLPPYFSYRPAYEAPSSTLEFSFAETPARTQSPFDFYMELVQEENGVQGRIHYNKKFYTPDFIQRLAVQLEMLSLHFFEQPQKNIGTAPFTTPAETEQIQEWSKGEEKPYNVDGGFAAQFTRQAAVTPNSLAVRDAVSSWTYTQLDQWSDGVAAQLQSEGVRKGDVVAVYLERSLLLTGTLLAIWKAGGIYLPLDPNFPPERISFILDHAGACLIVTSETTARINTVLPILAVGYPIRSANNFQPVTLERRDGAYLLYTSGSTGRPKGVLVEQGGMLNHLHSKVEDLQLDDRSIVAQTATQNFDISIWQLLAALLAGGQVIILARAVVMDVALLLQTLEEKKITGIQMVPAYLHLVMGHLETEEPHLQLPSLRWLVTAGEELKPALANRWLNRFPHSFLLNGFGPTEASDNITIHLLHASTHTASVPVGRPLANLSVYIVNRHGQWCPRGMKGEIWVSGIAVARGYWKDEQKTEQAFIANPFNKGERLYKTGDLGRWNEDGTIAFCGRKDTQVKIRGHRIEPGEIEQIVQQHPAVQQAAIRYWSEIQGGTLAGYVVWKKEARGEELRDYLKEWLPSYMIPAVWMELDALPLLPNGKIARQQLVFPSRTPVGTYAPPVTPTQKSLCRIWQEIIGTERVGLHENFFAIGGHSLLIARISNSIKNELGAEVPIPTLFQLTDIESLARFIDFHLAARLQPAELYEEIEL